MFLLVSNRRVMINKNGRGNSYCAVSGEIRKFVQDEPMRRHFPRTFLLIKDESSGIEDDQIPS